MTKFLPVDKAIGPYETAIPYWKMQSILYLYIWHLSLICTTQPAFLKGAKNWPIWYCNKTSVTSLVITDQLLLSSVLENWWNKQCYDLYIQPSAVHRSNRLWIVNLIRMSGFWFSSMGIGAKKMSSSLELSLELPPELSRFRVLLLDGLLLKGVIQFPTAVSNLFQVTTTYLYGKLLQWDFALYTHTRVWFPDDNMRLV